MTVTVDVQWALYGRAAATAGFRVLSCSAGQLNRDNFGEAIGRFSPGTPDSLPQVTVSYVASGEADGNYLAFAIHRFADADHGVRSDETGRPVVFTSYFCVPYLPLASAAVGYLPMYMALRHVRLPAQGSGAPLRITVAAATTTAVPPTVNALAKQVAALLVTTGRPACVISPNSAGLAERLQFIDTVMAQLPYGQRTRMTAATWVRPTHRDHRFRLYFSDAARDHSPPDHVVWWGRPDQTALTPAHGSAYEYQRFLEDESRQSAMPLSGLTNPHGFKPGELREMLADLGITKPDPEGAAEEEARAGEPLETEQATPREGLASAEAVLEACAAHAKSLNLEMLATDARRLRKLATSGNPTDSQRTRYRELIAGHGLLKLNPGLDEQEGRLYDALLALAFGKPLSYRAYCQVEDCLGNQPGTPPHQALLQAIDRVGTNDAVVMTIVLSNLRQKQQLHERFSSSLFNAVQLINLLAGEWERPQHFRTVCDMTLDYLSVARDLYEQPTVRRALRRNGFLAQALQASGSTEQYQIHALYRLLEAVYPDRLSRTAITAVLRTHAPSPATPALFAAVLMLLARPEDAELARDAYAMASLTGLNLDEVTSERIEWFLPILDQTSGRFVRTRLSQTGATGSGTAHEGAPGPGS